MTHLPPLIQDLGLLLGTAAVATLIFRKLKQPLVLGYILTGMLVGPHFSFLPTIEDTDSVKIWAEIGVVFLLFALGLEFSFKKLTQVGMPASITAIIEVIFMIAVGFAAGKMMGWGGMDSLFLGGILSISSTTIIIRAIDELNLKGRRFVSLVFGILIVEDIVAILLLVLLSTVAVTRSFSGYELVYSTGRLIFFLILWFVLGIYLLPVFFRKVQSLMTDEILLIVSIGLCFLMVLVASHTGFSPALGAFVMGSLIAETSQGTRVEHLLVSVKDLFAAVFFVSVGTLLDPIVIATYGSEIAIITVVTIVGKFYSSAFGALLSGQSLRHSVQTGMSLAQIGEFSFIIATLGLTLGVTSDFLYPIAVTVSAITSFTTPYLMKLSDPMSDWIEGRMSPKMHDMLARYQKAITIENRSGNLWSLIWKALGARLLLNSIIVGAIGLAFRYFGLPHAQNQFGNSPWVGIVSAFVCLIAAAPFLSAIVIGGPSSKALRVELIQLRGLSFGIAALRLGLGVVWLIYLMGSNIDIANVPSLGWLVVALVALFVIFAAGPAYRRIEKRFMENLGENNGRTTKEDRPQLAPWDATLAEFILHPNSALIGKTLSDSKLKERFGITVGIIERGEKVLLAPDRDTQLMPFDKMAIIGSEEQILSAKNEIESPAAHTAQDTMTASEHAAFGLQSILLKSESPFVGRSIRECGIREEAHGLIVGIERNNQRILSPDSSLVLSEGDLLWLVGPSDRIRKLRQN